MHAHWPLLWRNHDAEHMKSEKAMLRWSYEFSAEHRSLLQALIQSFVRSTLTLTFVIAAARVVFNIKVGLHACQRPMDH